MLLDFAAEVLARRVWVAEDESGIVGVIVQYETERGFYIDTVSALPANQGKGAAVLVGAIAAKARGFTHVLTMDSDGQHPADLIPEFMSASTRDPGALVLGKPIFESNAPRIRVQGRRISNWWANLETLWQGIGDSLYGFRVYQIAALIETMQ